MDLYRHWGGAQALRPVFLSALQGAARDARLAPFFAGVDVADLTERLLDWFQAAAAGSTEDEAGLRRVHGALVSRGLDDEVFDAFMWHLVSALEAAGREADEVARFAVLAEARRRAVLDR